MQTIVNHSSFASIIPLIFDLFSFFRYLEIWWLCSFISDDLRSITTNQSTVSIYGKNDSSIKFFSSFHWLSICSSGKYFISHDYHTVSSSLSSLISSLIISCVISTICSSTSQLNYVYVNTQLGFYSFCFGDCPRYLQIKWNIYRKIGNSSYMLINPAISTGIFGVISFP